MPLTELPEDLVTDILSSFSGAVDLCLLDTAYCAKSLRKDLLNIFKSDSFILKDFNYVSGGHSVPKQLQFETCGLWIIQRNIHVSRLYMDYNCSAQIALIVDSNHDTIKVSNLRVNINNCESEVDQVLLLLSQCLSLKSLEIAGLLNFFDDAQVLKSMDQKILSQLTELISSSGKSLSFELLEHLAGNCTTLRSISFTRQFSVDRSPENTGIICKLLSNNPYLRKIKSENALPLNVEMLQVISQCCPLLTHLSIRIVGVLKAGRMGDVLTLLFTLKHLEKLFVTAYLLKILYCNLSVIWKSISVSGDCDASDCTVITNLFTQVTDFTSITLLNINHSPELLFAQIAQNNCNTLTELSVRVHESFGTDNIKKTVNALSNALSQCKSLTSLSFPRYETLLPQHWALLAHSTSSIRSLTFSSNESITIDDIIPWMESNTELSSIDITSCKKITNVQITKLKAAATNHKLSIMFNITGSQQSSLFV